VKPPDHLPDDAIHPWLAGRIHAHMVGLLPIGKPGVGNMPECGMGTPDDQREGVLIRIGGCHPTQESDLDARNEATTCRAYRLALICGDGRDDVILGV
jgi:hypothetical protein